MFVFNLVEGKVSLFTNKQEFQSLPEETWIRAAEK